jgi:cysteine-rich repeat protein
MRPVRRSSWQLLVTALAGAVGCFSDGGGGPGSDEADTGVTDTSEASTSAGEDPEPTTCEAGCFESVCGDGLAMAPEECDDGDDDSTDACTAECKLPACGDGYVQAGEDCDAGPGNANDGACTLSCKAAVCGDGLVQVGEEGCDDGNAAVGDGCTPACAVEECGNGVVDAREACDDGDDVETDDCKADCTPAECGDGIAAVDASAPEVCDDANTDEADGCNSKCTPSGCGDGFLQPGEECDDGNAAEGDTCSALCERLAFHVFVTSAAYPAAMGGLAGADLRCNERAQAAGLPGLYRAWLSDGVTAASDHLYHSPVPYRLVGGEELANNWADLTINALNDPIDHDESGQAVVVRVGTCEPLGAVWTGTYQNGDSDGDTCADWTSIDATFDGLVGMLFRNNGPWTAACEVTCAGTGRLYCFEQPAP